MSSNMMSEMLSNFWNWLAPTTEMRLKKQKADLEQEKKNLDIQIEINRLIAEVNIKKKELEGTPK